MKPDLGGVHCEYSSDAGKEMSNELTTSDNDSSIPISLRIANALEIRRDGHEDW